MGDTPRRRNKKDLRFRTCPLSVPGPRVCIFSLKDRAYWCPRIRSGCFSGRLLGQLLVRVGQGPQLNVPARLSLISRFCPQNSGILPLKRWILTSFLAASRLLVLTARVNRARIAGLQKFHSALALRPFYYAMDDRELKIFIRCTG
jgi:hypothetical protein